MCVQAPLIYNLDCSSTGTIADLLAFAYDNSRIPHCPVNQAQYLVSDYNDFTPDYNRMVNMILVR